MEVLEIIVFLAAEFALAATCINIGLNIGSKKKAPELNPVKAIKEYKKDKLEEFRENQSRELAEAEQNRLNVILRNIEVYDGTSRGQEDVPRR